MTSVDQAAASMADKAGEETCWIALADKGVDVLAEGWPSERRCDRKANSERTTLTIGVLKNTYSNDLYLGVSWGLLTIVKSLEKLRRLAWWPSYDPSIIQKPLICGRCRRQMSFFKCSVKMFCKQSEKSRTHHQLKSTRGTHVESVCLVEQLGQEEGNAILCPAGDGWGNPAGRFSTLCGSLIQLFSWLPTIRLETLLAMFNMNKHKQFSVWKKETKKLCRFAPPLGGIIAFM